MGNIGIQVIAVAHLASSGKGSQPVPSADEIDDGDNDDDDEGDEGTGDILCDNDNDDDDAFDGDEGTMFDTGADNDDDDDDDDGDISFADVLGMPKTRSSSSLYAPTSCRRRRPAACAKLAAT